MVDPGAVKAVNSATGTVFRGEVLRTFSGARKFETVRPTTTKSLMAEPVCTKWSVVTTIYAPTLAVKKAASLAARGWCLVIVADTKTPMDYMTQAGFDVHDDRLHFLSIEQQKVMESQNTATGAFVRSLPYRHFARKNLGYLFAIQHEAEFIFDFDDDNILHRDGQDMILDEDDEAANWQASGASDTVSPLPSEDDGVLYNTSIVVLGGRGVFNPYPLLGASVENAWPRGQPSPLLMIISEHTELSPGRKRKWN